MPQTEATIPAARWTQSTPTYSESLSIADCLARKFATTRTKLAFRVAVWHDRKPEDVKALQTRIPSREFTRVEGGAL